MKAERNMRMVAMHVEDRMTLAAIGDVFGISGERVRQIVRHAGVSQSVTLSVMSEAASGPRVERVVRVCPTCSKPFESLPYFRRKFCCKECYLRSLRHSEAELVSRLQELAEGLGYTPSQFDINAVAPPSHMIYVRYFGSIRAAQERAGLEPNGIGGAGHAKARATP